MSELSFAEAFVFSAELVEIPTPSLEIYQQRSVVIHLSHYQVLHAIDALPPPIDRHQARLE